MIMTSEEVEKIVSRLRKEKDDYTDNGLLIPGDFLNGIGHAIRIVESIKSRLFKEEMMEKHGVWYE